jgi:hypothetical protein
MHALVKFKEKSKDGYYHWERVADAIPKQLFSRNCPETSRKSLRKNQQYLIYYDKIVHNELINATQAVEHYTTCGYWKTVRNGEDWEFKRTEDKGLLVSQVTACFPQNEDKVKSFIKRLNTIYRTSYNAHTKNNVIGIFSSKYINYCEIFGYTKDRGSVILTGKFKGYDLFTLPPSMYVKVRKWLEWANGNFINPISKENTAYWIKYLDKKFKI